jgi:hypothetical protein
MNMPRGRPKQNADSVSVVAERDPFGRVSSTATAIVNRYNEALARLDQTPLAADQKKKVQATLAQILEREVAALCEAARDGANGTAAAQIALSLVSEAQPPVPAASPVPKGGSR